MQHITIAAKDVVVGDEIYNSLASHPSWQWVRVGRVRRNDDGDRIILTTFAWETWKHPAGGVFVRRGEESMPVLSSKLFVGELREVIKDAKDTDEVKVYVDLECQEAGVHFLGPAELYEDSLRVEPGHSVYLTVYFSFPLEEVGVTKVKKGK